MSCSSCKKARAAFARGNIKTGVKYAAKAVRDTYIAPAAAKQGHWKRK